MAKRGFRRLTQRAVFLVVLSLGFASAQCGKRDRGIDVTLFARPNFDRQQVRLVTFYIDETGSDPLFTDFNDVPKLQNIGAYSVSVTTEDVDADGRLEQLFKLSHMVFISSPVLNFRIDGPKIKSAFRIVVRTYADENGTGAPIASGASDELTFRDSLQSVVINLCAGGVCTTADGGGVDGGIDAGGTDAAVSADAGADAGVDAGTDAGSGADGGGA